MPGELGAEQIYAFARDAGFSPDQAVTMTAIALAESGGNPAAHNPNGEDSRGLWQINVAALGNPEWAQGLDLYNPRDNAIAAWNVSEHGGDIGPWTVTHSDRGSRYLEYADEARQAAAAYGETADGNFDRPPANYYSDDVAAGDPGAIPFTGTPAMPAPAPMPPPAPAPMPAPAPDLELGNGSVQRFLDAALAQQGDRYVFNAHTNPDDPNPEAFDCSELVEWAAAQTGVQVSEASYTQYLDMKAAGTLISVEDAINTPGALLFKFPSEPQPGQPRQNGSHVAISLGDGRTMEAMSTNLGVRISEAKDRFQYAALIPGMNYAAPPPTINDDPNAEPLPPPPPPAPPTAEELAAQNLNSVDTDRDMLPDHFELKYTLDPAQPDTDGDGITDGYELIVLGTKADRLDTDFDQIPDGLEVVLGLDPLVADNPDETVPLAIPDELNLDTDGDGITDWGEELAGTDAIDPDSDDDGLLDGDEIAGDTDPLFADN
jgi:cell wall-associated NlpC family hydrolase